MLLIRPIPFVPPTPLQTDTARDSPPMATSFMIDDSDPNVSYSGDWSEVNSSTSNTSWHWHFTKASGATATLVFNGSTVDVYGGAPFPSTDPAVSRYTIDGVDLGTTNTTNEVNGPATVSWAQLIFHSPPLDDGQHTLTVTYVHGGNGIELDFFSVLPNARSRESSTPMATVKHSTPVGAIAGGTAAGLFMLVIASLLLLGFFKRRRRSMSALTPLPFKCKLGSRHLSLSTPLVGGKMHHRAEPVDLEGRGESEPQRAPAVADRGGPTTAVEKLGHVSRAEVARNMGARRSAEETRSIVGDEPPPYESH
ncbi:hypothetical protein Hypma_001114 [Hypsizygus marmoreus]|uniref:Uncharacterized protein n=1 Tax=Hypsizygus marmoreus TaxID=39966 RepID=A0A369JBG5_HYPMA|nr:hypothetical protein Hypma_001114 [Hypsizygus marmoreus]